MKITSGISSVSLLLMILLMMAFVPGAAIGASEPSAKATIDSQVKRLLREMTLEEKVGQMTQVTLSVVADNDKIAGGAHLLDPAKLEDVLVKHHVGSILNVDNDVGTHPDSTYTTDQWQAIQSQIQDVATKKTRLKIPVIYGIDAIHGANYTKGATLFPQAIALAATFNRDLARQEGEIAAREVKASGIRWNFYPLMDVGRQPVWSRVFETYGEDPYLCSVMGASYIEGHESQGVGTCLKHYVGYSFPWSGKDRTPAYIPERMLRETFLPSFAAGIEAGAPTVMVNSGEIDGVPGHANHHLLTDILRGELHFKGFAVSDWADIERLYTRDRVAKSPKEAVRMAVMAGVDMSMVPDDLSFYDLLVELVKQGAVPMSRIDEAVGRILRVKYELGLFKNPYPDASLKNTVGTPAATAVNLEAARESITLLKNKDSVLPLSKNAKVLVAGPNANLLSALNGAWTMTWQGDDESIYPATGPKGHPTALRAIQDKVGTSHVDYETDADRAVKRASDADVVLLFLGEKPATETPGNIDDLTLDASQLDLASRLEKSGKPVILVLIEARPRVIRAIADPASAIVMAYLPGMEGGRALADVLFGDVNPSGKLPITYPRGPNALTPYDHVAMEEAEGNVYNPEFPFGAGLSYTSFQYSDLSIDHATVGRGQGLKLSVKVTNTGKVAGKESVLLYLTDEYASVARPVRQLRAFDKVSLAPGESKTVRFELKPKDFSFINARNQRVVEPGPFKVAVGPLSQEFTVE
jgi:beta-glucosidase